jgi:Fe-S-cluster containining protein
MDIHYACTSCGKCCHGHHISLTLGEAMQWIRDTNDRLIVLVEAFLDNGLGISELQRDHAQRRSVRMRCGDTHAYVAIIFAVYNPAVCPFLTEDKRCGIYDRRPLVCRIYPFEINPHIQLQREFKDCPSEAWDESGPAVYRNGRFVNDELMRLIEQSRQADRDEIGAKAEVCRRLGIDVAALKGDGFATYLPDPQTMLAAMEDVANGSPATEPGPQNWGLHTARPEIRDRLVALKASVATALPVNGTFIAL